MSPPQLSPPNPTATLGGRAILHLRRGTYVAELAVLSHGILSYTGRRRERDLCGDRFYAPRRESVRLAPGEWVEWIDNDRELEMVA